MNLIDRIYQVFAAADQLNLDEWIVYLLKRLSSALAIRLLSGHEKIRQAMASSSQLFKQCIMSLSGCNEQCCTAEAEVTFIRLDNKVQQIPL